MGRVEGKVAFITGGAAGVGRSHALTLAGEGADIAIFDLGDGNRDAEPGDGYKLSRQAELDATVADVEALGRRALGLTGNVRNQDDLDAAVTATVAELGRLDILVANAGIAIQACPWELSVEQWELMVGTNLTGVWQSCKAVIPRMIEQEYGRIVLISSSSVKIPSRENANYNATKAGVVGLGENLALDLAQYGITVNMVLSGFVPSGSGRGVASMQNLDFNLILEAKKILQPLKGILDPKDISNLVLYLASDEARYVTGVSIAVDGGSAIGGRMSPFARDTTAAPAG